jgi:hypothetical protein
LRNNLLVKLIKLNNKKFWEELIAYFPLMRRLPNRKQASNNSSLPRERLYRTVAYQWKGGYTYPSLWLAAIGGMHQLTEGFTKYALEIRRHNLLTKFYENLRRNSEISQGIQR